MPKKGRSPRSSDVRVVHPIVMAPDLPATAEPFEGELARLERLHREMMDALDLSKSEGMLDALFGRPNHRIRKKLERAALFAQYKDAHIHHLHQMGQALEEMRKIKETRRKDYLDQVRTARAFEEEKLHLAYLGDEFRRRQTIEDESAKAVIANYQRQTRNAGSDLVLPPPPPDPLEESWRKKRQEKELRLQEHEIEAEYGGDKVTRANDEAMKVFRNRYMPEGEQYTRIIEILNAYDLATDVLPEVIQKLLEEEEFHDE